MIRLRVEEYESTYGIGEWALRATKALDGKTSMCCNWAFASGRAEGGRRWGGWPLRHLRSPQCEAPLRREPRPCAYATPHGASAAPAFRVPPVVRCAVSTMLNSGISMAGREHTRFSL